MLTEQELNKIISWLPYREDWVVDRNQTDDNINLYYGELINSVTKNQLFNAYYSEDGGLANYLEFMCYPKVSEEYLGNAILVCVSMCAPFATYGQITISKKQRSFGWGPIFNPEKAYVISDPTLLEIEKSIKVILNHNNVLLLETEFLSRQLPNEVAKTLKTENHNEGIQYLHGIFQKTD